MVETITRRKLLRFSAAVIPIYGLTSRSGASSDRGIESSRAVARQQKGKYRRVGKDLARLDEVWAVTPEDTLDSWAKRLRRQSLEVFKPGLSSLLPSSVDNTKTLLDQMLATKGIMDEVKVVNARRDMRLRWLTSINGSSNTVQEQYYTKLGYSVGDSIVTNQPYYALYKVLTADLKAIVFENADREQRLKDHANTVHNVLKQQILPEFKHSNGEYETYNEVQTGLIKNLEILDDVAQLIPKVVNDAPGKSEKGQQKSGRNQQGETVIVNAKANGATARVTQNTWKGDASNIIDQDPETQWQVAGNPDNILAYFTLPQQAQVTEDQIRIGTGGDRDVTRYELYARGSDDSEWQEKRVVEGSVTDDGTADSSHTFDSPIAGTEFALRITDHQSPRLCYSSCDVPLREYHLIGQFTE